jgi:hypothetical protein
MIRLAGGGMIADDLLSVAQVSGTFHGILEEPEASATGQL